MNRREFIGGIGALAALDVLAVPRGAKPYLRVGLFSDTHIKKTPESFKLVAAAFKTFKAQGVDAIVHCGDLADLHYDEAYAMYRAGLAETFGDKLPELVYSYADHDVLNPDWDRAKRAAPPHFDPKWAYGDMREKIGIEQDFFGEKKIGGLTFIAIPEQVGLIGGFPFVRERVAAACAETPDKPVILVTHRPPTATTLQSCSDGFDDLRRILNDFPQVICFHGHTHIPLVTETNIWQGRFTTINCGCLYEWHGRGIASPFVGNWSYWVGVAEFYRDRMIVRRFDVRTGKEVRADAAWCVPLPFVAKTAPYAYANARRRERKVSYPKGAALKVVHVGAPNNVLRVWVPDSVDEEKVALHRFRAYERAGKGWKEIALQDRLSEYHLMPDEAKGGIWVEIPDGYFRTGTEYRITATPVGFRGTEGTPLSAMWTAPKLEATELVWSCDDPMKTLSGAIDKKPVAAADGWWTIPAGKAIDVSLPREIWDVPEKTKVRFDFTVDILQERDDQEGMMMNLTPANGYWRKAGILRLILPAGKAKGFRYVKTFGAQGVEYAHKMTFIAKFGGKIRLRSVRLEKYVCWTSPVF